ncbi:MAG TPA: hypothetical protein VEL31_04040, partial [Ktedonobacteraceae bacterium]|nr:hypothetical protein [Ktedonobacteraceae bacterium]
SSYNNSRASWLNWRTNTTALGPIALMRGRTLAGEAIGVTMGIPLRYEKLQRCTDPCHSPWRQLLLLLRGLQGTLVCFEGLRVVIFEY